MFITLISNFSPFLHVNNPVLFLILWLFSHGPGFNPIIVIKLREISSQAWPWLSSMARQAHELMLALCVHIYAHTLSTHSEPGPLQPADALMPPETLSCCWGSTEYSLQKFIHWANLTFVYVHHLLWASPLHRWTTNNGSNHFVNCTSIYGNTDLYA